MTTKNEPALDSKTADPRVIEWGNQFKRDRKREKKGQHQATLDVDVGAVVSLLANRVLLEPRHRDHPMKGEWKDHRDCHVKPDLVMIYRVTEDDVLQLVRLGSHSELGIA